MQLYSKLAPEECMRRAERITEDDHPGGYIKARTENSLTVEINVMPDMEEWAAMGCLAIFTFGLGLAWVAFRVLIAHTNTPIATITFVPSGEGTRIHIDSRHGRYEKNLARWLGENLVIGEAGDTHRDPWNTKTRN